MPPGGTLRFQAVTAAMNAPGTPPVVDTSNVITLGGGPPPPPPPCTPGAVQLGVAPASVPPGAPVTVTVTGTPGAGVILFFSHALGSTLLPGPGPAMGPVICLGQPMHAPIGQIPPSGTRTIQFPTPPGAPIGSSLHYQAVTIAPAQPAPVVDTSNVATVTFTAPPPPPPCVPGAAILTITPDVPVQPGNTISVSVTATAGSLVVMARSHALGSTSFPFLTNPLCLAMPIDADFFGVIPAGGTLTQTHTVPPNAILPGNVTIEFQAVVVAASGGVLVFDTSNTDFLML
jgi:hypothetical protein